MKRPIELQNLVQIFENEETLKEKGIRFITLDSKESFISYKQLYNNSLAILYYLQNKGIKPGQELVFQLEDNYDFLQVFWASLLGGIIPVPIPVGLNDEAKHRLFKVWGTLNDPYLITTEKIISQENFYQKQMKEKIILLDQFEKGKEQGIIYQSKPDDIAYILFSSGSTGSPKGVSLTHENILTYIDSMIQAFNLTADDEFLGWTPLTHTLQLTGWHIVPMFVTCTQNQMETNMFVQNPLAWLEKASEHKATILTSLNFAYKHLLKFYNSENHQDMDLSLVRLILTGAEPISVQLCNEFLDAMEKHGLKRYTILPGYGMTEASFLVSSSLIGTNFVSQSLDRRYLTIGDKVREVDLGDENSVSFADVGYQFPNVSIRICDNQGNLVDDNIVGHIQVRGKTVTPGYYNAEELTTDAMTSDGWFKTGDIGFLSNGRLTAVDRVKNIIFVKGQNYYPYDLERITHEVDGIEPDQIGICGVKDEKEHIEKIVAFVQHSDSLTNFILIVLSLKRFFSKKTGLEIAEVVPVLSLSKTVSGKIQRFKLAIQYKNGQYDSVLKELDHLLNKEVMSRHIDLPTNEIEEKVIKICTEIFRTERIGVYDNLMELGLNSLKMTSLILSIHKVFDVELTHSQIVQNAIVKKLSELIEKSDKSIYRTIQIVEENESSKYLVSSAQKRIFALNQLNQDSTSYNISYMMVIEGMLDVERLKNVCDKIVERHDSLRTSFELLDGQPISHVHKNVNFKVEEWEVEENELEKVATQFVRPFDLSKAPLFRVGLAKYADKKYLLMFDMYHIISDGRSLEILIEELIQLYSMNDLPDVKIQYKDYTMWEKKFITSSSYKKQEEYWLNNFTGEIPVLNMPIDYVEGATNGAGRPAVITYKGDQLNFEIGEEFTAKLNSLAKKNGATLYMVLLAAYSILLSKYSGQEDIIVGSPIAGRRHQDLENIIGMFVNTLAIRNFPVAEKTFIEFLVEVKDRALKAYENQDYQFEMLVEKLNLERNLSRNPLFDMMFVLQNIDQKDIVINDLRFRPVDFKKNTAKFDIELSAFKRDGGLSFNLEYSTELFKHETMERFSKHFIEIVTGIIENSEVKIAELDMISNEEKEQILFKFNDTDKDFPGSKTIYQLFEEQVERTPEQIAAIFNDEYLTYQELNQKANQLARVLRTKGVKNDYVVGIMLHRSLEMIIGIFAIMKAGGAYLPIAPKYPTERIEFMLEDSNQRVLLTKGNYNVDFKCDGEILDLSDETLYLSDIDNLPMINGVNDLAYVIYTSGSTGKPKGVMIEHQAVVNRITWEQRKYPITSVDTILQKTPFTFDVSVWELFWWSIAGARVCFLKQDGEKEPETIVEAIDKYQITIMHFVPSMLTAFLNYIENFPDKIDKISSLRKVFASGEALKPTQVKNFNHLLNKANKTKLYNLYGPTEATVEVSYFECLPEKNLDIIPIGKPIDNIQLYILNKENKLQPIGVCGELHIGGIGLARGYLNRDKLTREKFIPSPFNHGRRIYKTGDLARWLPDGNIEYLGRIDHQVKVRGLRIELGEIEAKLLEHEDVNETVVLVKENSGDQFIAAYFTAEKELSNKELQEYLLKSLPDYMVPSYFVKLDSIPLTSNGKANRKALLDIEINTNISTEYVAPTTEAEEKLVAIFSEVLSIEKLGIHDNFFKLGGHSLKAIELISKIYKEFNVSLQVKEIFSSPTAHQLVQYFSEREEELYLPIERVKDKDYYPASSAQRRIFALRQLDDGITYNMPLIKIIKGDLNQNNFKRAVEEVIKRHDSFWMSFDLMNGEIVQRLQKDAEFEVGEFEVSEDQIEKIVSEFVRPFDLSKPPLVRANLIKCADKYIFMLDMYHIISDGKSLQIFIDELIDVYCGKELAKLDIQYEDYAVWQENFLTTELYKKQEQHWLEAFADEIPALAMSTDFPRPKEMSFEGEIYRFGLNTELDDQLYALTKENGISLFMVLMALYNILLMKYTSQEDIVVGTVTAGRNHPELQNIIGMFVNTLAVRTKLSGDNKFIEFLEEVKKNLLTIYENQDYQFDMLVEKLGLKRDFSRNPLFDTMFAFEERGNSISNFENITLVPYELKNYKVAKFDLSLIAVEVEDGLIFELEYNTGLFKKETIERLASHFSNIIKEIVANPEILISDIEVISEKEKHRLLFENNDTKTSYPLEYTIHQLFEEQVSITPDEVAVIFEDKRLTYLELSQKVNQLARVLRNKGVDSDQIVGIMVEKSLKMVIGIMGILKAGGAYLPLDPMYPKERISYILKDSDIQIFLTQFQFCDQMEWDGEIVDLEDERIYQGQPLIKNINHPNDLAYILYTSGSTGLPKGVMVEHQSVVNLVTWYKIKYNLKENRNVLQLTNYIFDPSVEQIFGTLLSGGRLYLAKKDLMSNKDLFIKYIEENQINIVDFIPSVLNELLIENPKVDSISAIICGGERLDDSLKDKIIAKGYQLYNHYGPTETTVDATVAECSEGKTVIGKPIANTQCYIVDKYNNLLPVDVVGELCISGVGLARGYLNRPKLTEAKFVPNVFWHNPLINGERMYKTGDLARWLPDGNIEFLGRVDNQVKIRGFRIELGEIENHLLKHQQVKEVAVIDKTRTDGTKYLCAYIVSKKEMSVIELREFLGRDLPEYMIPFHFVSLESMPFTSNGKIDRKALPEVEDNIHLGENFVEPVNETEERLAKIWAKVLGIEKIGVTNKFFEVGGDSIKIIRLNSLINQEFNSELNVTDLFNYSTIRQIAKFFSTDHSKREEMYLKRLRSKNTKKNISDKHIDIAVVGMSGRFPGANDLDEFWRNLSFGQEWVRDLPKSRITELEDMMGDFGRKEFGKAGYLDNVTLFEPEIFALSREESKFIDPQQRLLLELVEEAILDAGYNPEKLAGEKMGVLVAESENEYTRTFKTISPMAFINIPSVTGAGRISYFYNFTGPAVNVGTACSSALVALYYACQSLILNEVDATLVGGVNLNIFPIIRDDQEKVPILSINQQVRAFDKDADGTLAGEGGGVLFIKTLDSALEDGDSIYAIIKGWAINNDGNRSNGMSSPSEEGQADVVLTAIEKAEIDPLSLSYIETHGTGTKIGDPIEFAGLNKAFNSLGYKRQTLGIGSLKTNIGHLDGASGIASMIKTILALKNRKIPASLNFDEPNPLIKFENSSIYINDRLTDWESDTVRRAGVTSLGLIGTNAHIVIEEVLEKSTVLKTESDEQYLDIVQLSARTAYSLELMVKKLNKYLRKHPTLTLDDIAYTLNNGRRSYKHKFVTIAENTEDLIKILDSFNTQKLKDGEKYWVYQQPKKTKLSHAAFVIPDFVDEALEIYQGLNSEPVFKKHYDEYLQSLLDKDLHDVDIKDPKIQFTISMIAYAKMLETYAGKPDEIFGFGLGKIVSDFLSEKISFTECIAKVRNNNENRFILKENNLRELESVVIGRGVNLLAVFSLNQRLSNVFADFFRKERPTLLLLEPKVDIFYAAILEMMKKGLEINWQAVYRTQKRRRLNLPGYVFDRRSYYLQTETNLFDAEIKSEFYNAHVSKDLIQDHLLSMLRDLHIGENFELTDNLSELELDSVDILQFVGKVKKAYGIDVPMKLFFEQLKVGELFNIIEASTKDSKEENLILIQPLKESAYTSTYPITSAQKRLLVINGFDKDSISYNIYGGIVIEGELDLERFERAIKGLVQRHESFRTSFTISNGEPAQKIHQNLDFQIEYIQTEGKYLEKTVDQFFTPFDLSEAPLLRVGLVEYDKKYLFLFNMHHIISDGTSMIIFFNEFQMLYQGEQLEELRVQYKDFAVWQNEYLNSEQVKKQEAYWLDTFAGENAISVLNLMTDYSRPLKRDYKGKSVHFELSEELSVSLKEFVNVNNVTLYMVLLAALNVLLHKYTDQEDIIIGSPITGRRHADLEKIIGMFVNTLAMRNAPVAEKTFIQFLAEVKENALRAFDNQDYQFEKLVTKLNLERDLSRNPLFDIMFVLQNDGNVGFEMDDLKCSLYEFESNIAQFDITFEGVEIQDRLIFNIYYATQLYKEETINRICRNFANLLNEIILNPELSISEFEMITDEEKQQLLVDFNDTKTNDPNDQTIVQLFEAQVERTPERIAAVCEDECLTYRELNERANQLGRVLRKHGAGPEELVGIIAEPSLEMIIGMLAIVKAGGAYLPINPDYPEDRIAYTLKDSQTKILLTQQVLLEQISFTGEIIQIDDSKIYMGDSSNLNHLNKPDDLLYVIYTSGSTGKPKGVMIEHQNLIPLIVNARLKFDFNENDVWTMFHSFCFDFSVWEMYGPLLYGGKMVVIPKLAVKNPAEFLKILKKEKVTVINQTPTALYNLSAEEMKDETKELQLRYILFGGEAAQPIHLKAFYEKYPETKLINVYGITETTVLATFKVISTVEINTNLSNIGKPLPDLKTYLFDKNMHLVPIGAPGEICIAGYGVSQGYLNRPALTAEKFVQNPYVPDERLYRSGDLARLLPNGEMEYLGRIDHQVNIRGFRIELGEIENQLLHHQMVKEAVVIARNDAKGNQYICAYLILEGELSIVELREYLLKQLPEYMIPAYFMQLDKIPTTSNGKVDRKALPEPIGNLNTGVNYEAPKNEVETKLANIWSEVLGVKNIGINNKFFEVGGDSLKIIRLTDQINHEFNSNVTVTDLFKFSTIREMSSLLTDSSDEKALDSVNNLVFKNHVSFKNRSIEGTSYKDDDIAIIGISGRFPGADNLEEFWSNLASGKDLIRDLPESRIDELNKMLGEANQGRFMKGGHLDHVTLFEPEIFALSYEESKYIDPQHRLLLELVEEAILDSGYDPLKLSGQNIGVFLAMGENAYTPFFKSPSPMAFANMPTVSGAGRVAYLYNFAGPALNIDTACSSSLVALHNACQSLIRDETDAILIGGVSLDIFPVKIDDMEKLPIISHSQQIRTFDKDADGTILGEGGGIIFIKLVSKALEDGDPIHAIIKGSAINSDGRRSNGMSSPSEDGQADVILSAVKNADIDPLSISYIETHGTGTKIGDPIEVAGISQALNILGYKKQSVPIGSLKTNIGHLDKAAGIANVIKAVLSLKNKKIPASLHFDEPNPLIRFEDSPVYVNDCLADWESDTVRRVGVTSLGLIGTNAHVIVEEFLEEKRRASKEHPNIVRISARTRYSLENMMKNLRDYLVCHSELTLDDIAYTLNQGRRSYKHNFIAIVENTDDLINILNASITEKLQTKEKYWLYQQSKKKVPIVSGFFIPDLEDVDLAQFKLLSEKQPGFKEYYDQSINDLNDQTVASDLEIQYIINMYSYAKLMETYSVKPVKVLGIGRGIIIADLISGKITLEECIEKVKNYAKAVLAEKKVSEIVNKFLEEKVNFLIVFAPDLRLTNLFTDLCVAEEKLGLLILKSEIYSLYCALSEMIKEGLNVEWDKVYHGQNVKRLNLPGYVFDRKSFYLKSEINTQQDLFDDFGLNEVACEKVLDAVNMHEQGICLLCPDNLGIEQFLARKQSQENHNIIQIRPGTEFKKNDERSYTIRPNCEEDFEALFKELSLNQRSKKIDTRKVDHAVNKVTIRDNLYTILRDLYTGEDFELTDYINELDLDSIDIMQFIGKVKKAYNVDVKMRLFFESLTLNELFNTIEKLVKGSDEEDLISVQPAQEYYPVSSAQKRMLVLNQLDDQTTSYNISLALTIEGKFDKEAFENAIYKLFKRHEAFRTSFAFIDGEAVQKIHPNLDFKIEYIKAEENELDKITEEFYKPFDLSKAPLLRVGLVEYADKHLFMIDMQHIISDGFSMDIFFTEFIKLYNGEKLDELRIQYKDFAIWHNGYLQSEEMKQQQAYWLNLFKGEIPVLNVPIDYPRPLVRDLKGDFVWFELNEELTAQIHELAKSRDMSLYMLLLSAFNLLLYKYTGQEDIVIGSPIAGRRYPDVERIIGMFVNTLVMRNYLAAEQTFTQFMNQVKENTLQAFENQDYPFEMLVERLNLERNLSHNPLFDVMFVLQNAVDSEISSKDLKFYMYEFALTTALFDLTFEGYEIDDRLGFNIQYATQLFKKETIERMTEHFCNILNAIIQNPELRLSEINMISPEGKYQLTIGFNETNQEYPKDKTIQQLFEENVEKRIDQIAVIFGENHLTYGELNEKANQLARILTEKGVKPDKIVGIMMESSLEMFIGILGILKADGAYLPIDPKYPINRIEYMLSDSKTSILLTQYHLVNQIKFSGEMISIDAEELYRGDMRNLPKISTAKDLAYVIYTSGSTGKPKGVMIEHHSLVNLVVWYNHCYKVTDLDRSTKYAGFSFDASVLEIFPYMITGSTIHIIPEEIRLDINMLNEYFENNRITISFLPTQLCEQFMNVDNQSLRLLLTGGDKLRSYKKRNYQIVNIYGPAENTVATTSFVVDKDYANIPIGKPIANTKVYILDAENHLQPIGIAGELCIVGDGLSRGYLNHSNLTEEKFVLNIYQPGRRMYRTGDLARWLADGSIEFLGRIDDQVQIRGFRIELGEIENQLLSHPKIRKAVVMDREDTNRNKYLCAYIVSDGEFKIADLRRYLGKELPDYMIPAHFISLDQIPLTPNGKIDRRALPKPDVSVNIRTEYVAPKTEVEKKMAEIWSEILGVERVGVNDNFFELGGHSLTAISVVQKVNEDLGVELPLREFMKNPKICELASSIRDFKKVCVGYLEKDDNLILLKTGNDQTRHLFLIHDGSGEVGGYIDFCEHIISDFNYWGIRADRLEDYPADELTIEEIARKYIEKIRVIQPDGSYYIAGWSLGGTIAFEMISQLEELGEEVAFGVLIDTYPPELDSWEEIDEIAVGSEEGDLDEFKNSIPVEIANVIPNFEHLSIKKVIHYLNVIRILFNARVHYIPTRKIDTQIHFFKAIATEMPNQDEWNQYCIRPMKVYEIAGDHFSIFRSEEVVGFAEVFGKILR